MSVREEFTPTDSPNLNAEAARCWTAYIRPSLPRMFATRFTSHKPTCWYLSPLKLVRYALHLVRTR